MARPCSAGPDLKASPGTGSAQRLDRMEQADRLGGAALSRGLATASRERGSAAASVQRRESGRNGEHVLLLQQQVAAAARRRPDATLHRLGTDALALARILVGPDVDPLVERAELAREGADQRRELGALADRRTPAVDHLGDRARLVNVCPELVEPAELPGLERRRERRRDQDLRFHMVDELADRRRPDAGL